MKVFGLSSLALALVSFFSLVRCPHSKVEESFNLQASHDLYYYGFKPALKTTLTSTSGQGKSQECISLPYDHLLTSTNGQGKSQECISLPYDHLQFPGVVPRTFSGPLILSSISKLASLLLRPILDLDKKPLLLQCLTRLWLLLFNIHAHSRLARALNSSAVWNRYLKKESESFALGGYFLIITAVQFHIPFYASRMLPNTFALVFVTHAYAEWMKGQFPRTLALLVVTTVVFRCDVVILLFTVGLTLLLRRKVHISQCIWLGILTAMISLLITVPLDSILWQRFLWPEGEVLIFNTVENRSSEYGTSPWHWYGTSAIPKTMLGTFLLLPLGLLDHKGKDHEASSFGLDYDVFLYFLPVVGFLALYSILPHKEVRFIFVILPLLNCLAAKGMHLLHHLMVDTLGGDHDGTKQGQFTKISLKRLLYFGGLGTILLTFFGSQLFVAVSQQNYPGGDALLRLAEDLEHLPSKSPKNAYIDVASAMSGAMSLFGVRHLEQNCIARRKSNSGAEVSKQSCKVIKGGYEYDNSKADYSDYDYILSESDGIEGFKVKYSIKGHPKADFHNLRILNEDAIYVHERARE